MKIVVSLLGVLGLCPVTMIASAPPKRVDARERHQQARIVSGVKSGALTPRETVRLERGQVRVHRAENRAKSDGALSPRERAHLERMQDKQSARIYRQKHDASRRSP